LYFEIVIVLYHEGHGCWGIKTEFRTKFWDYLEIYGYNFWNFWRQY